MKLLNQLETAASLDFAVKSTLQSYSNKSTFLCLSSFKVDSDISTPPKKNQSCIHENTRAWPFKGFFSNYSLLSLFFFSF